MALEAGLTVEEVRALWAAAGVPAVFDNSTERALIEWVDRVATFGPLDESDRTSLRRHLPDHQIVEVTILVGATLMLNRFCTALDLPTAPGVAARLETEGLQWGR